MRRIDTYDRFDRHVRAWAAGEIENLVVLGRPGVGKTWAVTHAVGDQPCNILSARQTPLKVYNRFYDHSTWPVIFDDVSALVHDNNFIDMLKSLCESGARAVRWGTTTDRLNGREKEFTYSSTVLILLNEIPEKNPDVPSPRSRSPAPNARSVSRRCRSR